MKDVIRDADTGLSPIQILILRTLVAEGEMTQALLVTKIGRDKSQVTRLIHDLVEKKLVIKRRSEKDKRSFILMAVKEVHDKVTTFIQYEQGMVHEMLKGIPQTELLKLDKLLLQMQDNLKRRK